VPKPLNASLKAFGLQVIDGKDERLKQFPALLSIWVWQAIRLDFWISL